MTRLLIFCLTLMISSIVFGQKIPDNYISTKDTTPTIKINLDTSKIVILDITKNSWLKKKFKNQKAFKLTQLDIEIINKIFTIVSQEHHIDSSHFLRQYIPFKNKSGQKKIWINCFCRQDLEDLPYWKNQPVLVEDGGKCYFNFYIILMDTAYYDFEFNPD